MKNAAKTIIFAGNLTLQEVLDLSKLRKTKLYELIKAGLAPAPIKYPTAEGHVGVTNRSYWCGEEWYQWLADRKAARDFELQTQLASGRLEHVWFPGKTLPKETSALPEGGVQ